MTHTTSGSRRRLTSRDGRTDLVYYLIRSSRRTLAAEVRDGELIVRAPLRLPLGDVERFLTEHRRRIDSLLRKETEARQAAEAAGVLTETELKTLTALGRTDLAGRVQHFAPLIGVDYGRITIRHQKTRWGSCSREGNLNFNVLLMLAPPAVRDAIVVHELCHRKEMNHSDRFYALVRCVYPAYDEAHRWLREHGRELLARLPA